MNDRALKVLEQYDLEITGTRRGRGSYILETTQGLRILSDYNGSENKAMFQNCVMNQIREGGYERVDLLIPNKEGSLISRDWEDHKYVVKEWYAGRECDTGSESEVLAVVANLARLHRLMKLKDEPECGAIFKAVPPQKELHAQNTELRKVRSFVRKKHTKCAFERMFLDSFEHYYEQAAQAEDKLIRMEDKLQEAWDNEKGSICHGDYDHHHVLLSGYDIATISFESCRYDLQISDLYRFMRKILEKHEWNPRLGMRMLEQYTMIRPISRAERRLLYIKMLYPEKFRKLANYYYGSNKAWVSGRFLEKMNKLNAQEEHRLEYVNLLERQM